MNDKKNISLVVLCYLLWGFQPLYWAFLSDTDSMFLLMTRILWAAVFALGILAIQRRLYRIKEVFCDKETMKRLIPAAIFTMTDWGIYMFAVQSGHVLDASLGYYMNPLVLILIGVVIFHEKCRWQSVAAIVLVLAGIVISAAGVKTFPFITISLALAFPMYAIFMKNVKIDAVLSTCVQVLMMSPIAILFIIFFRTGDNGMASVTLTKQAFLIGAGVVTLMPIILYANCIKKLPLMIVSFLQYLTPTFGLFCGLILGESLTKEKLISFAFIWAGIVVFSISSVIEARKARSQ